MIVATLVIYSSVMPCKRYRTIPRVYSASHEKLDHVHVCSDTGQLSSELDSSNLHVSLDSYYV